LTAGDGDFAAPASGRERLLARNFRRNCNKERSDTFNADPKDAWASSNVPLGVVTRLSGSIQGTRS
jgi:hypothetical protein